jgi:hypothetical protein
MDSFADQLAQGYPALVGHRPRASTADLLRSGQQPTGSGPSHELER